MRAIDADALDDILADGEIKARKNRKYVLESAINTIRGNLAQLPSIPPERKRGKWIKVNGKTAINCSACYHCSWSLSFEDTVKRFNFCPNCGADMRGEQDDSISN